MQILLTGASGFVGSGLIAPLLKRQHSITAAVRELKADLDPRVNQRLIGGLSDDQDWQVLLKRQDTVKIGRASCRERVF